MATIVAPPIDNLVVEEKAQEVTLGASGLPEDIEKAILTCDEFYRKEDEGVRQIMISFWKKLENLFNGIQRVFWDDHVGDWRREPVEGSQDYVEPLLYDKIINIYRAHGEALIAALSVKLPTVNFLPDDADSMDDVDTAKAYSKISDLLIRHNQGILLFIKALWIHYNQGLVGAYVYNKSSNEYGTVEVPIYGPDTTVYYYDFMCPVCEYTHHEESKQEINPEAFSMVNCPQCGNMVEPFVNQEREVLPTVIGYEDIPKCRTVIDIFGPLYVQVSLSARQQKNLPYVRLRFEQENALLRQHYEGLRDKISVKSAGSSYHDRFARDFTSFGYLESNNRSTVTCGWLRPWAFQVLGDDDLIAKCQERFPDGCYYELINDKLVASGRNEDMDKKWVFTEHPLSDKLHCDPMGKPLAPIQDIETEVMDLAIETFEHCIPETFADPNVLDFGKYKKARARPGSVYKAKKPTNASLAEGFHTLKPATLTEEIRQFDQSLEAKAQFSVGSFPSIYGGPSSSGSKTASEYSESRAMARQRLNTPWTMFKYWWARVIALGVDNFAKNMLEDERYVQKSNQSETKFTNVWIRQAELTGKVGQIEPDPDEELPVSFAQIKGTLQELITLNNPEINGALFSPSNLPLLKRASGLPDLTFPGQNSRDKQYSEFKDLLAGIPVPVDPDVDDHIIEADTCQFFMTDSIGLAIKRTNPEGYEMIRQHFLEHRQFAAEMLKNMEENQENEDNNKGEE